MNNVNSMNENNTGEIYSLDDIEDDETLFTIEVKNKELTEPLKIFTKLLNNTDHMGAKNLREFCQIFAEKLMQMNINYEYEFSVHLYVIPPPKVRGGNRLRDSGRRTA